MNVSYYLLEEEPTYYIMGLIQTTSKTRKQQRQEQFIKDHMHDNEYPHTIETSKTAQIKPKRNNLMVNNFRRLRRALHRSHN